MPAPSLHPAQLPVDRLLADCELQRTRRSGPGGQHRNKVETAVVITHVPTGTTAEASERRSQEENKAVAVFRLRMRLALDLRIPCPGNAAPSLLWQTRCRGGKISVNSEHSDFPALVAEALDLLHAQNYDLKATASILECTTSQLIKFLQQEPRAMLVVNAERERNGLHRLK
ncbi:MAG: peptide chain release factor-like protein [Planctomycetes bacterium]|nr:peptide chain release factor-like protein [Planctomycetota bacterium]